MSRKILLIFLATLLAMNAKTLLARIRYYLHIVPEWDETRHASCWDGTNASRRMMNILSPFFSDGKFREYLKWMQGRGCDTAHVFLINRADGEGAGYNCATNPDHAKLARKRIEKLRKAGFAVVPWIIADDSKEWARDLFRNADKQLQALDAAHLFNEASYVVLGLEMDEYGNQDEWNRVAVALRTVWRGKVGAHHKSGNSFPFSGLADIVLGQLEPKNANPDSIAAQIAKIKDMGKSAVGFEYSRGPDRRLAQAALDAGAIGCGNW